MTTRSIAQLTDALLGPAGITVVAALLDQGVSAADILWVGMYHFDSTNFFLNLRLISRDLIYNIATVR